MVGITGSASTAFLSFRSEGFRASSTAVIGSVPLIRIQNIGETTGTKLMMFTSPTSITDITCTTDAIQAGPGLRLAFRFERSSPIFNSYIDSGMERRIRNAIWWLDANALAWLRGQC